MKIGPVSREEGIGFQEAPVPYLVHMMDRHGIGKDTLDGRATMQRAHWVLHRDWKLSLSLKEAPRPLIRPKFVPVDREDLHSDSIVMPPIHLVNPSCHP